MATSYAPAPGILGSGILPGQEQGVFTHNPYWYPGFNALALTGVAQPKCADRAGMQPWPVRALRSLKGVNLKYHLGDVERQQRPTKRTTPSESASDQSLGHSDGEGSMKSTDSHLEAQLIQCIVKYFGDCKGSLPSERVQNVIKKDHPELYEAVVVTNFRKKWHKFLQHCCDTFQLFTRPAQPAPNQDYCWRIRLVSNPDWEEADQQEEEQRSRADQELLDKVRDILRRCPGQQCTMIDVITEINKDMKGEDGAPEEEEEADAEAGSRRGRKIRAGDLKRMVRRSNSSFIIVEAADECHQKKATFMQLIEPHAA